MQWPKRDGPDTGIDLIAEQYNGELCAIQCKCYDDNGNLEMKQVSKFLAKASGLHIEHKILVYTGETITNNAHRVMKQNTCQIITQDHLRDSSVDWSDFPKLSSKDPKKLRPHQIKAVEDVMYGLTQHDRGKLIMACGTGKTLTSLHIAEKHAGRGGMVLYLVPSISLILQSMREWSENANIRHSYLTVCSDKSTGEDGSISELESPVSTDAKALAPDIKSRPKDAMTVVFSTYHSIDVVRRAMGNEEFDLILCDEAHRTTGAEDKSFFTTVHKDSNIHGKKRLYMTATPRVYSDVIKAKLGKIIYSMDDETKYGPEFHKLSFTDAVKQDILSDFKVKIAIAPADKVDKEYKELSYKKEGAMSLDERTLLAAVWHGITHPDDDANPKLLQRVIAFANRIDRSMMFAGQITDGEDIDRSFDGVVDHYEKKNNTGYRVDVDHIDGKTKALSRRDKMHWLNESTDDPNTCRILSNAKCLSEGVDVPALDGVIFLNPRKSRVDVVQSVGRVMRKSKDKSFGYVILPVALPIGIQYHEALDDNKTFRVVWQVLNALRSHDEDFGNEINRLVLGGNTESSGPPRISISVLDDEFEAEPYTKFFNKIKSKIVEKVGDINYYDKYGQKLGSTSRTIEERIKNKVKTSEQTKAQIQRLHNGLKEMINDSVTFDEAVQVVAQHMVLSKVFHAMFQGKFASYNPVSEILDSVISKLELQEELVELKGFYAEVENELKDIKTREARQNFIKKIYENFFKSVAKKETEQHGIVYTPVEVIDFIIYSVQHILEKEFQLGFNNRDVKIFDPFTGTGTFLTRLLESGLITDNMYEKYRNDLYANEMLLLAYYVAAINIETTYSSLRQGGKYVPFENINYTDTLQHNARYRDDARYRHEASKLDDEFKKVRVRIRRQKESNIHVIMGNPPYSAGQSNYNDDSANIVYPELDKRLKDTYVAKTNAHNKNSLYDSYIRSLRWASDRIGKSGIIAFITNASFIKSEVAAGIRASLAEEFTDVWCFDLRGNQRTQGETSKREGGKIFGSGSRTPVAITILVKNPNKKKCTIHYKDIGNYLTREQKLSTVRKSKSITGITDWQIIKSDEHHDWLDQRDNSFLQYATIGDREAKTENIVFKRYWNGVATSRDMWSYNSSKTNLGKNMKRHIGYCMSQNPDEPIFDSKQAKWSPGLSDRLKRSPKQKFDNNKIRISLYRPFFKQYLYLDKIFVHRPAIAWNIFPENHSKNLVICVPYKFTGNFSTFITDMTPDLELVHHGQCFPLHIYKEGEKQDNITDSALLEYQTHYGDKKIAKKSIFYYVYGLLHHSGYKRKFANNLARELPHIPMAPDFWKFSKSGEKLVDLHLNFETCQRYDLGKPKATFGNLEKMAFAKVKKDGKQMPDKTKLKINGIEIFENVPRIDYTVNGRTPLEWIIDRYRFTTDADSGITNNPCEGMTEQKTTEVVERMIFVGIQSDKIISDISKEEFEPKDWTPKKTGLDAFADSTSAQTTL